MNFESYDFLNTRRSIEDDEVYEGEEEGEENYILQ